ncbi:hypothetical protein JZ751_025407 [Albula glossodonta]|uniref:Uncharacterized protein n=1 Tax=Albula glossodonta TaxID=121402 RepID=A0A8T2NMD1_9TELE|nr:hypothetical protein JZ751_025407 [Albula glossodonta]
MERKFWNSPSVPQPLSMTPASPARNLPVPEQRSSKRRCKSENDTMLASDQHRTYCFTPN